MNVVLKRAGGIERSISDGRKEWLFADNPQNIGELNLERKDLEAQFTPLLESFLKADPKQLHRTYGQSYVMHGELEYFLSLKKQVVCFEEFLDVLVGRKHASWGTLG